MCYKRFNRAQKDEEDEKLHQNIKNKKIYKQKEINIS